MERDIERRKKREGSGCWPRRRSEKRKGEEKKGRREEEREKE